MTKKKIIKSKNNNYNNCKTVIIDCWMDNLTVKKTAKEQYENIVWDLVLTEQFQDSGVKVKKKKVK